MGFKDHKKVNEEGEPTNNTNPDNFATVATPLFTTKRFGRMKEYVIPRDQYAKMKHGRTLGDRWMKFVEDEELQGAIRKTYHDDTELLLTCAETNVSSIIRKVANQNRIKIQKQMDASSESGV